MASYYVNRDTSRNPKNDHEVHTSTCHLYPLIKDTCDYLGEFSNCHDAVEKAKMMYLKVDGCIHCCTPCHNQ